MVIMMTVYGSREMLQGALELGAVKVVSKPFEMGQNGGPRQRGHRRTPTH